MSRGGSVFYEADVDAMHDVTFRGDQAGEDAKDRVARDLAGLLARKGTAVDTIIALEGDRITPMTDVARRLAGMLNEQAGASGVVGNGVAQIARISGENRPVFHTASSAEITLQDDRERSCASVSAEAIAQYGSKVLIVGAMAVNNESPWGQEHHAVQTAVTHLAMAGINVSYCTVGAEANWRPAEPPTAHNPFTLYWDRVENRLPQPEFTMATDNSQLLEGLHDGAALSAEPIRFGLAA